MKYWAIIADKIIKAGWHCGLFISSTGSDGRRFWVAAGERQDAGRFIVYADEKLTAFLELESAIRLATQHCLDKKNARLGTTRNR